MLLGQSCPIMGCTYNAETSMTADIKEEIALIIKVLTHPAGFNIDLFGGLLSINSTEDPCCWEVTGSVNGKEYWKSFSTVEEAAMFFCEERRRRQLGIDLEKFLMIQ